MIRMKLDTGTGTSRHVNFSFLVSIGWFQVNDPSTPVCYGAKDDSYGKFVIPSACHITRFKLVYVSGPGVTSNTNKYRPTYWGTRDVLAVHITDGSNTTVCPSPSILVDKWQYYRLPGVTNMDPQLTLPELSPHLSVPAGREFRVWFSQDLLDAGDHDNGGQTCLNVWILKY